MFDICLHIDAVFLRRSPIKVVDLVFRSNLMWRDPDRVGRESYFL